uniref:Pleckstrin homology domain containing, family H (with MyTH4 domain) member 1 n=1 Tax=Tetraodon nigroviridis TaxID=99883 RepID=H3C5E6_TETNG
RCAALEMQLLRFRIQAGKIRELLAEKMQELEEKVTEADQRADDAEKQVRVMEEKLKSANIQTSESESPLYRKHQDLTIRVQEKDAVIQRLEAQVLARAQEAKVIEEKAGKIKDWVTLKLKEMEQENQQLKMANLKQAEQILLLQDKLQDVRRTPEHSVKGICLGELSAHHAPVWNAGLATPAPRPEPSISPRCPPGGSDRDNSSDELNDKFRSQCLHSSTSSSSSSSACEAAHGPSPPESAGGPASLSRSPSTSNPFPTGPSQRSGASTTLPKVRTPLTPRDSVQLAKKHSSQPQPSLDRLRPPSAASSTASSTLKSSGAATPAFSQVIEETDIDDGLDGMDGVLEGPGADPLRDGVSFVGLAEELELLDQDATKPPTPPLHRFPSWESRIYAVAKSGMRVSEAGPGARSPGQGSSLPQFSATGPFSQLIHRNVGVPVYTALKGKATQISSVPLAEDESGSEDDSSSLAGSRSSIISPDRKGSVPGSPRAVKRGVSMSSVSSESDYAIPPDACSLDSDYSEPEHKVQRTSSYSCESTGPEVLEKSGYLLKMGNRVQAWKRRWFILRNGGILYYKSPSEVIRKPQGQIQLNSCCRLLRGEGAQTFQLITEKKTFYLTADSPNILEDWIRVLQNVLKVQASGPLPVATAAKPSVRGWLTKVQTRRHSKLVWCSLVGKVFSYYRVQEDKLPLGQLQMHQASVQEVDRSCDSDEDYEVGGRGFLSSHCTLVVKPREQSPTYLLIGTRQEKDTWLYHLTVAAGSSATFRVGTEYEQLIGELLDADGDPESALWRSEALSFTKEGLRSPLTTLPSEALQTEALKLFKSCQLFINVLVESPSVDYHTSLAQNALQVCLTHPELQNEMYCQLIKQTNQRTPHNHSLTQCWQLLSLCVALFLPQQHVLWYLKQYLRRNADPRSEVGKYAVYCQRSVERTQRNGERESRPSRMEIVSILLRNPYHHSLPFSIPVHFTNSTYQVVGFDGSTTVEEFLLTLTQRIGARRPQLSGFALFTDDPSGRDPEHCLHPSAKICDVISKWEQALKELHPGKNEGTRIVRLTYKNRLCFRAQAKGETERERLLLVYQVNDEVQQGHFPVNKELALEVAALLAQVEHGDLEKPAGFSAAGPPQAKSQLVLLQVLDRFYPKRYRQDCSSEQFRDLLERLAHKWSTLRGCGASECVRTYLTVARKWPLFGAKLYSAEPVPPCPVEETQVWLAVNEDGLCVLDLTMNPLVSYPYQGVVTFGGCRDDFMVVTSQQGEPGVGRRSVEKLVFAMAKAKILELTLLMADYMNHRNPGVPPASHRPGGQWEADSRHVPARTPSTKGPTLL